MEGVCGEPRGPLLSSAAGCALVPMVPCVPESLADTRGFRGGEVCISTDPAV